MLSSVIYADVNRGLAKGQSSKILHLVFSPSEDELATSRAVDMRARSLASVPTFVVCVAEKSIVCLSFGRIFMICLISSSNPISRIRSASSIMRHCRFLNIKPLVFWRWSSRRPGVETKRLTPCRASVENQRKRDWLVLVILEIKIEKDGVGRKKKKEKAPALALSPERCCDFTGIPQIEKVGLLGPCISSSSSK